MTAIYIALEGPDGVGKSTTADALCACLKDTVDRALVQHFPTQTLLDCAQGGDRSLKAEDYLHDMERWLAPIRFPDEPPRTSLRDATTVHVLDRWVLSTFVYAQLRGETIPQRLKPTLEWLNRIPMTTFVLMPRDPAELTDPDYPDPDGYNPLPVAEAYRKILTNAFVAGEMSRFIPITVDRTVDTPDSVAATIAEWTTGLQRGLLRTSHMGRLTAAPCAPKL